MKKGILLISALLIFCCNDLCAQNLTFLNDTIKKINEQIEAKRIENKVEYSVKQTIKILSDNSNSATVLYTLTEGDKISLIDLSGGYYKVFYSLDSITGWIGMNSLISDETLLRFRKNCMDIWNLNLALPEFEKQRDFLVNYSLNEKLEIERKAQLIKKYGTKYGTAIGNKEIMLGMTKAMVIESWGQPDSINKTVGSWGVHEQLVYGSNYVYIENNLVTSWQSTEK